jgi:16S rRNA (cytidine1402-2'-O)-methyltransferase
MKKSKLYILPNVLFKEQSVDDIFPPIVKKIVNEIDGLICESRKEAIRYLIKFLPRDKANNLPLLELNEHSKRCDLLEIVKKISNEKWGLISDCGMPIIADPGSDLIYYARENKIEIEAVMGPSSIFLALLLSGFSSQSFYFHGYLPRKVEGLEQKILDLESNASDTTHLWIEAPYRFKKMIEILIKTLDGKTNLCVAKDIMLDSQEIINLSISEWKKLDLSSFEKKHLAIFLIKKNHV